MMLPIQLCDDIVAWGEETQEWKHFTGVQTKWAAHDFVFFKTGESDFQNIPFLTELMQHLKPVMGEYGVADGYIRLTRYCVDHYIGSHQDVGDLDRKLSIVIQLSESDEYEGGDLVVEGVKMPRDKGAILTHDPIKDWHEVLPVTRGTRYTLVIWAK